MNIEDIPEPEDSEDNRQPTVAQLFIRMAVEHLTPIQQRVWELHAWDRLTQDEIAKKLGKARTTIETQIKQCEKNIAKWCANHRDVYEMLNKDAVKEMPIVNNGIQEYKALKHKTPIRRSEWDK